MKQKRNEIIKGKVKIALEEKPDIAWIKCAIKRAKMRSLEFVSVLFQRI